MKEECLSKVVLFGERSLRRAAANNRYLVTCRGCSLAKSPIQDFLKDYKAFAT